MKVLHFKTNDEIRIELLLKDVPLRLSPFVLTDTDFDKKEMLNVLINNIAGCYLRVYSDFLPLGEMIGIKIDGLFSTKAMVVEVGAEYKGKVFLGLLATEGLDLV